MYIIYMFYFLFYKMIWEFTPLSLVDFLLNGYIFFLIIVWLYFLVFIIVFMGIGFKLWDIRDSFNELIEKIEEKEKNSWN